jgi:hypothetical protein
MSEREAPNRIQGFTKLKFRLQELASDFAGREPEV